jgi:hypothetical protein
MTQDAALFPWLSKGKPKGVLTVPSVRQRFENRRPSVMLGWVCPPSDIAYTFNVRLRATNHRG